jgi:hypothetical protein
MYAVMAGLAAEALGGKPRHDDFLTPAALLS